MRASNVTQKTTPMLGMDLKSTAFLQRTSSMGWFFSFKLHIVINAQGELMTVCLTPGNTDDRKPVTGLFKKLQGLVVDDKGYISKKMAVEQA